MAQKTREKPGTKTKAPLKLAEAVKRKRQLFQDKLWPAFKASIDNRHSKSDLLNFTVLLTNMMTLMAWRTMDLTKAEYEGKAAAYWFCVLASYVILAALFWHIICLVGCEKWGRIWNWLRGRPQAAADLWRRRSPAGKLILASIPLAVLLFAGIAYFRPQTTYYAQIGERYGIPVGEGESLSSRERRGLAGYWRMDDYPWQSRMTLTYVEAYGQLELLAEYSTLYQRSFFQPAPRIELEYRTDKEEYKKYQEDYYDSAKEIGYRIALRTIYFNSGGKPVLELRRNGRGNMEITSYASEDAPQLFNSTLLKIPDGQSASGGMISQQIETLYRSDGLPQLRRLCSQAYNLYGVNGEQYSYNQDRQLSSLCYLNADGDPACNKLGIMTVEFEYGDDGKLRSTRYYSDLNGTERVEGFFGVFCEILEYDEEGKNLVSRRQKDRGENWCYDANGVYQYSYQYSGGALTQESFRGVDEAPALDSRFHSRWIQFSAESRPQRIRIQLEAAGGAAEQPESLPGTAILQDIPLTWNSPIQLNAPSDILEIKETASGSPLDVPKESSGEDTAPSRRYSVIQYTLKKGVVEEISYWDSQGNSAVDEQGCAARRFAYDNQRRVVRESYWDGDGRSCCLSGGYAAVETVYRSEEGPDLECTLYLDADGQPAINRDLGCAIVRYEYSGSRREIVRKSYYDRKDNLMALPDAGCAEVEQRYDTNGFLIQETFYNTNHAVACRVDTGVAKIRYEYGSDGNLIRMSYWDQEDCAVSRRDTGYALVSQTFSGGQLVEKRYEAYGERAYHPVPDRESGAAVITYRYSSGQKVEERYLDAERAPVLRSDMGCASRRFEYEAGRLRRVLAYGLSQEPVLRTDYGCAVIEYDYDEHGRQKTICYYGTDGQPIARSDTGYAKIEYGYDDFGRDSYVKYYGADGRPVIRRDTGYAGRVYRYPGGNDREWQYIGTDGQPMLRGDGYGIAWVRKTCDPAGNLLKESYRDAQSRPAVWKEHGYSGLEYSYYESGDKKEVRYFDAQGGLTPWTEKGYAVEQFQYDDCGRIRRSLFYDKNRNPVISTEYHCAGFQYEYDERGCRSVIRYLGLDGQPMVRRDFGFAEVQRTYDGAGNLAGERYFDTEGKPALWKERGYASFEDTFENGVCVESRYFDTEGNPVPRADYGYASVRREYDSYGRCLRERYFDAEGKPVISGYYHCAGFQYEYDGRGRKVLIRYLGPDEKPMARSDFGIAEIRKFYDETGNLVSERYYDCGGAPAVHLERGFSYYQDTYENGKVVLSEYFDENGAAAVWKGRGHAAEKREYNEFGKTVGIFYLNAAGDLTIHREYDCAGFRYAYDAFGNQTDTWYVGPEGEESLMVREDLGYAHIYSEYDELGQETSVYYYLSEDRSRPAAAKDRGCSSFEKHFENGLCVQIAYRDAEGTPMLRSDEGYAVIRYAYDEYRQKTSEAYFGADGETPALNQNYGCAGFQYGYDERGNQTDVWTIGSDGQLLLRQTIGAAHTAYSYDGAGNRVCTAYYLDREQSRPAVKKEDGYVRQESEYKNGKRVEERFYDAQGKPALSQKGFYASARYAYNPRGQCASIHYFGQDGTPVMNTEQRCAGILYDYDERGLQILTQYVGLDGSPICRDDIGYASIHSAYDKDGNEVLVEYRDTGGALTPHKTYGYARAEYEFTNGYLTASRFYGADGRPVPRSDLGYAVYEGLYDEDGNWIEGRYYDAQGNLTRRTDWDLAVIRKEYDEKNRCVFERYYDEFDRPAVTQKDHCAGFWYEYDEKGNQETVRYIGPDGAPMIRGGGYGFASIRKEYDAQGRLTWERCLDLEGKPAVWEERGYSSKENRYDAWGRLESVRYYDAGQQPVNHSGKGFALIRYTYDEAGVKTREAYYDAEGNPVLHKELHCASIQYSYDDRGNAAYCWYYGEDGALLPRESGRASLYYRVYDQLDHAVWAGYYTYVDGEWQLLVPEDKGYAALRNNYGKNGFWMGCTYLNAEGAPVVSPEHGYAELQRTFDENGQLLSELFLGPDGQPVDAKHQYAKREWTYSQTGETAEYRTLQASDLPANPQQGGD